MNLNIGDEVLYRKNDMLYKGVIKSIRGEKIEIDDKTVELVIAAISKNTIGEKLVFDEAPHSKLRGIPIYKR